MGPLVALRRLLMVCAQWAVPFPVLLVLMGCSSEEVPTPTPLPPLTLPADEAPHDFQTEWWYWNLHINEATASTQVPIPAPGQFAIHYVLFQVQEQETNRTLYVAHVGLADAVRGTYHSAERVLAADSPATDFDFALGKWLMAAGPQQGSYRLRASAGDVVFDLQLRAVAQPLLHNGDGLVDFEEAGVTYYYTLPRLAVAGTIAVAGRDLTVAGTAWMDKQWGNFQPLQLSWDWASVQLDSGYDLMLTKLRDREDNLLAAYGTLGRGGAGTHLGPNDFTLEPVHGHDWVSPVTGFRYPTSWRLAVPGEAIDVTLTALVEEAEFRSNVLGVVYWEAGMEVSGSHTGQAFVELTGRGGNR